MGRLCNGHGRCQRPERAGPLRTNNSWHHRVPGRQEGLRHRGPRGRRDRHLLWDLRHRRGYLLVVPLRHLGQMIGPQHSRMQRIIFFNNKLFRR